MVALQTAVGPAREQLNFPLPLISKDCRRRKTKLSLQLAYIHDSSETFEPYLRLANPNKGDGSKTGGLLIGAIMPPIVENDAPVVVVGEWLDDAVRHGHSDQAVKPCRPLHPVVGMVEVSSSLRSVAERE